MSTQYFILSKYDESIAVAFVPDITAPIGGQFVVETPDGVQIDEPLVDYADLKTKKYAGIEAMYPDYPGHEYDEFDSEATIDLTWADHRATTGKYDVCVTESTGGDDGTFQIIMKALGFAPQYCLVLWQVYEETFTANNFGGYDRNYVALDPTEVDVEVSVDNGVTFDPVSYNADTLLSHTGTQLIIRFTNTNSDARRVGYYSFLYRT